MNPILDIPAVAELCQELKKIGDTDPFGGDSIGLVGEDGIKWVNLVLQGGGTLGIGHVGVLHGLELAGFRFAGIAGTSAGAIAALLVAACRKQWTDCCGPVLLDVLSGMPAQSFIDGPYLVRRLIKEVLLDGRLNAIECAIPIRDATKQLLAYQGLNPGIIFEDWLQRTLRDRFDISSMKQLSKRINEGAPCFFPAELLGRERSLRLKMIATGLPFGHKFVFPQDADVLEWDEDCVSPALYARASMSIPFFFVPLIVPLRKSQWRSQYQTRFAKRLPKSIVDKLGKCEAIEFVDGGILSNFPIDAFANEYVDGKQLPTIGLTMYSSEIKIETGETRGGISALIALAGKMFDAARLRRDRDAVHTLPEIHKLVMVDTGPHNWLNFSLDDADVADLFLRGLRAARALLIPSKYG